MYREYFKIFLVNLTYMTFNVPVWNYRNPKTRKFSWNDGWPTWR